MNTEAENVVMEMEEGTTPEMTAPTESEMPETTNETMEEPMASEDMPEPAEEPVVEEEAA